MSRHDLTALEHRVLLRAFGLHGAVRQADDAIAAACSIDAGEVATTRDAALAKVMKSARSDRERFHVIVDVLKAHPDVLGEMLRQLIPAVLPPKTPRLKRERAEALPRYKPVERLRGQAVYDEKLRAKVVRVNRALIARDGIHEFDLGNAEGRQLFVCRDRRPSYFPVGIYWYTDDECKYIAGIDWPEPYKPVRSTIGTESFVITFDDTPAADLADAQPVDPMEWRDD